jgi:hypothetical protein
VKVVIIAPRDDLSALPANRLVDHPKRINARRCFGSNKWLHGIVNRGLEGHRQVKTGSLITRSDDDYNSPLRGWISGRERRPCLIAFDLVARFA